MTGRSRQVLGIDPGMSGALAWVGRDGSLHEVEDMPVVENEVNERLLSMLIPAYGPVEFAVVEKVGSMPRQGVSSSFKFGMAYGAIRGILATYEIPYHLVPPNQWKGRLKLNKDKERSRKMALARWPEHADWFKLKKHENRAEAALMAISFMNDPHAATLRLRSYKREPRPVDLG